MSIPFTKMHGLGNDYIYVNTDQHPIPDPAEASIRWSRPHTGVGSDGLILVSRVESPAAPSADGAAHFRMRIFNADGSEAMMCGNGARCVGKYVYDHALTTSRRIILHTLSGQKTIDLEVGADGLVSAATVDMGAPRLADTTQCATPTGALPAEDAFSAAGRTWDATFVSMGNPHVVIFISESDLADLDLPAVGPQIEHDSHFPERVNVEFAAVRPGGTIRMRVWERGSGITQACGTGACATAVAAIATGRVAPDSPVAIVMDGGVLTIRWPGQTDAPVLMTGPATTTFEGELLN